MGTKNNPKNRKAVEKQKYKGKEIEPVYYCGNNSGHGNYMAAKYSGSCCKPYCRQLWQAFTMGTTLRL